MAIFSFLTEIEWQARGSVQILRIEELRDVDSILSLSDDWKSLQARADYCVPFLQPEYVGLWARTLGRSTAPLLVTAWDGRDLVGYAPFMRSKDRFGPFPVPTLKFIGNNVGYPGDILYADIVASKPPEDVTRAILAHVRAAARISKYDLGFLHPRSPTISAARELLGLRSGVGWSPSSQPYLTARLPTAWDDFMREMSANTRMNFRRRRRRLREMGDLQLRVDREPDRAAHRVGELIRNHDRWWKGTPKERWLGDQRTHQFLGSAARLLASQNQYLAFTLELDGTPIAWDTGAFDGYRYFSQLLSFDRDYAAYSPGVLLSILDMGHLISTQARYAELGPGDDQRKRSIGGKPTEYLRVKAYRGMARGVVKLRRAWKGRRISP